jgi:alanyl-tRNA synthetase
LFKMYDTYGFPVDLTSLMGAEHGLSSDEAAFEKIMQASKQKAKATWKSKSLKSDEKHVIEFGQKNSATATKFVGYDSLTASTKVLALSNGSNEVTELKAGDSGFAILNQTSFYAEGGGQAGDHGKIISDNLQALVHDCTKVGNSFLHQIEIISGSLKINDPVKTEVDNLERRQIMANHSATHLMHSALRQVLGTHVTQAGSLVDATKTRFDITHGKPITKDEIKKIEDLVNNEISMAHVVSSETMSHKKAIDLGAMALFGEKYGDEVRVLSMGSFSTELCGGTHVKNTSQIRAFKIMSESGVSAGVRRIEAITGDAVIEYFMQAAEENKSAKANAALPPEKSLLTWIEDKKSEIKNLQKEIQKIQAQAINIEAFAQSAKTFNSSVGVAKFLFADIESTEDREVLVDVTAKLQNKIQTGIVVVIGKGEATHPVYVSVSKDLTAQFPAGTLLKDLSQILGGKGGGRPDLAQGAATDRSKLNEAMNFLSQKILK